MDSEIELTVDGRLVQVPDDGSTLLETLRTHLGVRSAKDGCAPQGQCGCCTVMVDGQARVACVTPTRRVAGRSITTLDGLEDADRQRWAEAFTACGASQCGVCTPGIVMRCASLNERRPEAGSEDLDRALAAHLCRCTGWQTVHEAWDLYRSDADQLTDAGRDLIAAAERAGIEGGVEQRVGTAVALGAAGFAADTAPDDALIAVPDSAGGWIVAPTLQQARAEASKVQGRRTTVTALPPLEVPEGEWAASLATSWVEPAYVETDAAWCAPGGQPASPLANGGAFGAKVQSPLPAVAQRLADEHGQPVVVFWSREDATRLGPKRPPLAVGLRSDGTGVVRVVATEGIGALIHSVAPLVEIEELETPGPPTSAGLRAAGWAELVAVLAAARCVSPWVAVSGDSVAVTDPSGGSATVTLTDEGISVLVDAGQPLDEIVLRSYCIGAVHMALSWVTSESLTVEPDGNVADLTIRSFGVLRASDMPHIKVEFTGDGPAVRGSDAVFAATAAAVWLAQGQTPAWPTGTLLRPVPDGSASSAGDSQ